MRTDSWNGYSMSGKVRLSSLAYTDIGNHKRHDTLFRKIFTDARTSIIVALFLLFITVLLSVTTLLSGIPELSITSSPPHWLIGYFSFYYQQTVAPDDPNPPQSVTLNWRFWFGVWAFCFRNPVSNIVTCWPLTDIRLQDFTMDDTTGLPSQSGGTSDARSIEYYYAVSLPYVIIASCTCVMMTIFSGLCTNMKPSRLALLALLSVITQTAGYGLALFFFLNVRAQIQKSWNEISTALMGVRGSSNGVEGGLVGRDMWMGPNAWIGGMAMCLCWVGMLVLILEAYLVRRSEDRIVETRSPFMAVEFASHRHNSSKHHLQTA